MGNKKSFWDSSFKLMSDKGREIISNPELSKKLYEWLETKYKTKYGINKYIKEEIKPNQR